MKYANIRIANLLFLGIFSIHIAGAQERKGDFFGYLGVRANFCQIDGDQASGYNKFGFSAGYTVGQVLKEAREGYWSYLGGIEFSIRGSRRAFNPDNPGDQSFHFVYQMVDIPLLISRNYKNYSVSAGLRTTYLLSAKDNDNFVLDLGASMRDVNMLGCVGGSYQLNETWSAVLEIQYSINSIRNNDARSNLLFPTGVYHNVISIGTRLQISGKK